MADIAQNKLDVFYTANRLNDDEYIELTTLVQTIYTEEDTLVIKKIFKNLNNNI